MPTSSTRPAVIAVLVIAALVALGVGVYLMRSQSAILGAEATAASAYEGVVTDVNLNEMAFDGPARITFKAYDGTIQKIAVPSMGRSLCTAKDAITTPEDIVTGDIVSVRGAKDEEGYIVPCMDAGDYLRVTGMVSDAELEVQFSYRKGPNGYVLEPLPANLSADEDFVKGYKLTLASDERELESATAPREGPPTIQMRAYKNPDRLWATLWPSRHARESNIELATGKPVDVVVGGANAVKYTASGLYSIDTYVVAQGSYMYVFTGEYLDADSPMRGDFEELIKSVVFTPGKG